MPLPHQPRPCAPYAILVEGQRLASAPSLLALFRALASIEALAAADQQRAQAARDRAVAQGAPWRDLPERPPIHVVDARGVARWELSASWRIKREFGPSERAMARATDPSWDGDYRPRGAPVEGTGRRVRYSRAYLRRPRTQRARRLAFHEATEGEPAFRGARRAPAQPTAWEDLPRRSRGDRGWKRYRNTQWRP